MSWEQGLALLSVTIWRAQVPAVDLVCAGGHEDDASPPSGLASPSLSDLIEIIVVST
jgi:hypothetical protein